MKLDHTDGGQTTFLVRFRGVRGSHPVTRPGALYFGGHTSCIEVQTGDLRIVFDLGSGCIPLGEELAEEETDPIRLLVLVTHLHHDHTMGFPFFAPAYASDTSLTLTGPGLGGRSFQGLLEMAHGTPFFPVPPEKMPAHKTYLTLGHQEVLSWASPDEPVRRRQPDEEIPDEELVIRTFRNLDHPDGGVLNYRLERAGRSLVLATDVEGGTGEKGDTTLVEFAKDTDLLIHDAQYTDEEYASRTGWGHSTWRMAIEAAKAAQARRLVLYSHDPSHDDVEVEDIERRTRELFSASIAASEGLEIRL
ncbi:MAG: MBL fold metallo-hydrolase [Acidobacteriota bacterium]